MNTNDLPTVKTVTRSLEYYGARVITTTIHHDKSRTGLRTVRMQWLDQADPKNGSWPAGTTTEKLIKGDGRDSSKFTEFVPEHAV